MPWKEITLDALNKAKNVAQDLGSQYLPDIIKRQCHPSDVVCKLTDNYSLESILPSKVLNVSDFVVNHPYWTLIGSGICLGMFYLYKHPEQRRSVGLGLETLGSAIKPKHA